MPLAFSSPHWLTKVFVCVGVCALALETQFPEYAGLLKGLAALCAVLAAPGITSGDRPKPPDPTPS